MKVAGARKEHRAVRVWLKTESTSTLMAPSIMDRGSEPNVTVKAHKCGQTVRAMRANGKTTVRMEEAPSTTQMVTFLTVSGSLTKPTGMERIIM